jgi:ABC-2 type transport system ATP-binding protein
MGDRERAADVLRRVLGPDVHDGADAMTLVGAAQSDAVVAEALLALSGANVAVSEFSLGQPSLDEVFFALTGHPAEERTSTSESEATP